MASSLDTNRDLRIVTLKWCPAQSPWRIGIPLQRLRREGFEVLEISGTDDIGELRPTDILVIHQPATAGIIELMRLASAQGVATVIDADDLLLPGSLPPDARFAYKWDPGYHRMEAEARVRAGLDCQDAVASAPVNSALEILQACLLQADAVTVSTPALADAYRHLNATIYVLPNCYDDANPLWDVPTMSRPTVNIGFLGTEHHGPNLDLLTGVLEPIVAEFPTVRIVEAGQGNLYRRIDVPPERMLHLGWTPFETYPLLVRQIDIMLAPLTDEPFMRCKSNIRCMVAGLVGAPAVASPVGPYSTYIEDGVTGILAASKTDWLDALRALAGDSALRRRMGEANRRRARAFALSVNIERWIQVYGAVHRRRCCA